MYVSRAGEKLQFGLANFNIDVKNKTVADFGSSTGGFVDCLLESGASKVYSVDVSYGELAWKLRNDPKVLVMERTNAMHVKLPESVDLITIDTAWTKQIKVLENAFENLKPEGKIISLIKPHYEALKNELSNGKVQEESLELVLERVKNDIMGLGGEIVRVVESPILGKKGENREFLALIKKSHSH